MAELLLKIGAAPGGPETYQNGDIVNAFSDLRIRCVHAEHICKPQGFASSGLRVNDTLAEKYLRHMRAYEFQRVSEKSVRRTNLATLEEEIFSDVPNQKNEYIDVPLFVEARLKHNKHLIFGTPGAERWYGGTVTPAHNLLNAVWTEIETGSPFREVDHRLWPKGTLTCRQGLLVTVEDFDESTRQDYERPEKNEAGEILKKRRYQVPWQDLSEFSARSKTDALDPEIEVDGRATATPLALSVVATR